MLTPEEKFLDYRRCVAAIYADVRNSESDNVATWQRFRQERDELFCTHPQSALSPEQQSSFSGLPYFDYDPAFRFILPVEPTPEASILDMPLEHDGLLRMRRFGKIHFTLDGQALSLSVYSIMGYGGGAFFRIVRLPIRARHPAAGRVG